MNSFLAQCPHCMTSFRVSEPQLEAAGGMVRCGACLGVFSAPSNRITIKQAMTAEQIDAGLADDINTDDEAAPTHAPSPADSDIELELDYQVTLAYGSTGMPAPPLPPPAMHVPTVAAPPQSSAIDDPPERESQGPEKAAADADKPAPSEDDHADLIRLGDMDIDFDDADPGSTLDTGDGADDIETLNGIAGARRERDEPTMPAFSRDVAADDASRIERRRPHTGIQAPAVFADGLQYTDSRASHRQGDPDYYTDISMPGDFGVESDPGRADPELSRATPGLPATPAGTGAVGNDVDAVKAESKSANRRPQSARGNTIADAGRIPAQTTDSGDVADDGKEALREYLAALEDDDALEPLEMSFDLDTINTEPVTITSTQMIRRRRYKAAAAVLSVVLVLQLGLFAVDRNLDTLVEAPRFGPFLPIVCRILECPVPEPRSDLSSLYSQDLLIRSHPRYDSALEVSFIFRNDAATPQPFPAIELGFSDTRNRVLVNRLFQPDEYLPPELRDLPEMPAQTSLQISLELADPGSEAVNYTLAFREP